MIINSVIKGGSGFKTITSSKSGNGEVYPTGTLGATKGQNFSLYFSPNAGYVVDNVVVDGTSQGAPQTYTFSNVQADHTVNVTFDVPKYTLGIPSGINNSTPKNIYWADGASGMTEAQRDALIQEHTHFAVVNWDGSKPAVNYWLYRNNLNEKATDKTCNTSAGTASDLTGVDGDVMVLYDPVWWKVTKSGDDWRITFTWSQPSGSGWVSPHTYGDDASSTSIAQYVGLGVFEAVNQNSQMRSVYSTSNPTVSVNQNSFYNAAVYGRNWQYNNMLPMTYAWYVICLYFVKGDRNCQNAYGNGLVSAGSAKPVTGDWSATSPWINGTTEDSTHCVTALGVHNPWGNVWKFMGEARRDANVFKISVLGGKDHYNIESGAASTWKSINASVTAGVPSEIVGVAEFPFLASATSGTDYSKYYSDQFYATNNAGQCVAMGGIYAFGMGSGPLCTGFTTAAGVGVFNGARLHVLITEE